MEENFLKNQKERGENQLFVRDALNDINALNNIAKVCTTDEEFEKELSDTELRTIEEYWDYAESIVDLKVFDKHFPNFRAEFNKVIEHLKNKPIREEIHKSYLYLKEISR